MAPAVCEASTQRTMPFSRVIAPTSSTGMMVPVTFDAWVMTTIRVFCRIRALMSAGSVSPACEHGAMLTSTPREWRCMRGRITELCSMPVVMTWSPALSMPRIEMLSASVAFLVNTIRRLSSTLKRVARSSLVSMSIRAASTDRLCPDLPGFAPTVLLKRAIASIMASGFGHEVAALSR